MSSSELDKNSISFLFTQLIFFVSSDKLYNLSDEKYECMFYSALLVSLGAEFFVALNTTDMFYQEGQMKIEFTNVT